MSAVFAILNQKHLKKWGRNTLVSTVLFHALLTAVIGEFSVLRADLKCIKNQFENSVSHPPELVASEVKDVAVKVLDLERLKNAVTVVDPRVPGHEAAFQNLADGTYPFMVVDTGEIAFTNRVLNPGVEAMNSPGATFLGSHAGIAKYLEFLFKRKPKFIAAGEIIVRNGRVAVVSNKSGTFRGGKQHLDFAKERLLAAELPVDARTEYWDYSAKNLNYSPKKKLEPHAADEEIARIEIQLVTNPHMKALWDKARATMRLLDRKTHGDATPLFEAVEKPSLASDQRDVLYSGIQFLSEWASWKEGEGWVVQKYHSLLGEKRFTEMLDTLYETALGLPRMSLRKAPSDRHH